jgi:hypothetical protein
MREVRQALTPEVRATRFPTILIAMMIPLAPLCAHARNSINSLRRMAMAAHHHRDAAPQRLAMVCTQRRQRLRAMMWTLKKPLKHK